MPDDPEVTAPAARARDRTETVSAILMAVAAVTTAWCSYQATRWNAESTLARGTTNRVRIEAARAQGLAQAQTEVDVATYIQWVDAHLHGDDELQAFYEERFRPEFKVAMDAWLATDPVGNPEAPLTPFAMPEYHLEATAQAEQLDAQAEASSEASHEDIQRASNYVLGVVLCAVVLFLAGMSTKLSRTKLRVMILATASIVYLSTLAWVATFPISIRL